MKKEETGPEVSAGCLNSHAPMQDVTTHAAPKLSLTKVRVSPPIITRAILIHGEGMEKELASFTFAEPKTGCPPGSGGRQGVGVGEEPDLR